MKRSAILELTLIGIFVAAFAVFAEVPHLINYQGTITGQNGPLDGSFDLTFRMYADSLSGSALWTELHTGVKVNYGLFNVILGSTSAIPDGLFENPERWIGITVGTDSEVSPRMKITSVPWAMRAAKADTALYARSAPSTGDTCLWDIDGTNIYRLNGNVGIGTTPPSVKLHVSDARFSDGTATNLATLEQLALIRQNI